MNHRGPWPTHRPKIAFHSPGRGHRQYPFSPGCLELSSCSWRCWQPQGSGLCTPPSRFSGGGGNIWGGSNDPTQMYFSIRLSRVLLSSARCRWQRSLLPVKHSVCRAGSRRSSQNSHISCPTAEPCAAATTQPQSSRLRHTGARGEGTATPGATGDCNAALPRGVTAPAVAPASGLASICF